MSELAGQIIVILFFMSLFGIPIGNMIFGYDATNRKYRLRSYISSRDGEENWVIEYKSAPLSGWEGVSMLCCSKIGNGYYYDKDLAVVQINKIYADQQELVIKRKKITQVQKKYVPTIEYPPIGD